LNVFLNTQKEIPINSVDTQQKKVALTFDAAYGPEYTEEILGILDKYNIKATFFLVGNWALRYPEKVKEIYSRGHEIGNHSDTHPHFTKLNPKQMRQEIYLSDSKIKSITGKDTELFRPPFGDYNSEVVKKIWETGHYCIQWDVDSLDWTNPGEDKIYKNVMDNVQNGSIILFHNNAEQTPHRSDQLARH
jgi:polysaccharide deacetylase family sporulation protein PdaB